jgi:hypothetical protein
MRRSFFFCFVVLAFPQSACDDLQIPVKDMPGASTDGGEGGPPVMAGIMPAGALPGEAKVEFGGTCQTWAVVGPDNVIKEFSWTLPISTLEGIPDTTSVDVNFFIVLPDAVVQQTLFKSIEYSYFPHGHAPAGVYDVGHWEWHVSNFTADERAGIDCNDMTAPPAEYYPMNWFLFPQCSLRSGFHAFDLAAPEFNREKFTKGHYSSYYHGVFGTLEPQATRDVLAARQSFDFNPSPQGMLFGKTGLFPQKLSATYNGPLSTYVFTYSEFVAVTQ